MTKLTDGMLKRVVRYGGWGLGIGGFLCLLPVLAYLLAGDRTFLELHTSFPRVVALYLVGGGVAGAIVGVTLPVIQSDVIAAVAGAIIGMLFAVAMKFMENGAAGWHLKDIAVVIILGSALGAPLGVNYRRQAKQEAALLHDPKEKRVER